MRLTIEAEDSIERVLAVVGALYQVELTVGTPTPPETPAPVEETAPPASTPEPAPSRPRRRAAGSARAARSPRTAAAAAASPDSAAIRSWARENSVPVSPRGRIPASVLQQYQAAQA